MRGLIGKTLSHSYSKRIHEQIDNQKYDLIELQELGPFFQEKAFKSINITNPYKNDVIKYCDEVSDVVKVTQACNTIINKNGKLYGYNTDYDGLKLLLKYNNITLKNKVVGIIGNGSTSRTVELLSKDQNASKILVFARNPRGNQLLLSNIDSYDFDVLIHATPFGMYPNNENMVDIDFSQHKTLEIVVDLIYNPLRTKLLQQAQQYNKQVVNGLLMLVHQAIVANELFNNVSHDEQLSLSIYQEILKEITNLIFIGMPMSGKTYISRQISSKYNKEMIDLDNELEDEYGIKIPSIFELYGESKFRAMEKEVCLKYAKRNTQAISTGGGIILDKENIEYLKQNGIIIFLDVPLQELIQRNPKDRPLLQDQNNVEVLYNNRIDLYRKYADIIVEKRGFKGKDTVNEIEVKLNEYLNIKWA